MSIAQRYAFIKDKLTFIAIEKKNPDTVSFKRDPHSHYICRISCRQIMPLPTPHVMLLPLPSSTQATIVDYRHCRLCE